MSETNADKQNLDKKIYRNNPKYWDRWAFANSIDPDWNSAASDQDLHCLTYIQQYFRHIKRKCKGLFQILGQVW